MLRIPILLLILGLAAPCQPALAQVLPSLISGEDEAAPGPAPKAEAAPKAVAFAEVPFRARDAEALLREVESSISVNDLGEIQQSLPVFLDDIAELNQPIDTSSSFARRRELHDLLIAWQNMRDRMGQWRRLTRERTELFERHKKTVDNLQQTWSLTRAALTEPNQAAARSKADQLLAKISETQSSLSSGAARLFELEDRLDGAQSSLDSRGELLRKAKLRGRAELFAREGRPIWDLFRAGGLSSLVARPHRSLHGLRVSWVTYRARLPLHLLLLALGLFGLRALAMRARVRTSLLPSRAAPSASTSAGLRARGVLDAPILSGLFIALVVARFTYAKATFAAIDTLAIVSLVVVTILADYLAQAAANQRLIRWLAVVLALYRACSLSGLSDGWLDLALLATSALLFSVLAWAARLEHHGHLAIQGTRLRPALRAFLRAAWLGLSLALAAGLLGYYGLLEYLLEGFAVSAHWLLLCITLTHLLSALVVDALDAGPISRLASVIHHGEALRARALWAVQGLGTALWCLVAFQAFELLEPSYAWLRNLLAGTASIGSWTLSLGGVSSFFLTMYLASKLAQVSSFFLDQDILPRMALGRGVAPTVSRLTRYIIMAAGFVFAVGTTGIDMSKVALVASALSVGIGFGLQNVVNNFVSGLIIVFERPVRVGDTIQVGDLLGEVQSIGIRASTIRTAQGAEAIVPNAELISNRVINWTLSDVRRRIDIPIGVAFGSNARQVIELLQSAAKEIPGVATQPAPNCIFVGFGESTINFELRIWGQRNDEWPLVRSAVAVVIYERLTAAGVNIAYPQRDLHLRSVSEAAAQQLTSKLSTQQPPQP
jgi:small-conductance mechanosensitive channel